MSEREDEAMRRGKRLVDSKSADELMAKAAKQVDDVREMRLWLRETVAPAYVIARVKEASASRDPTDTPGSVLKEALDKFSTLDAMLNSLSHVVKMIDKTMIQSAKGRLDNRDEGEGS